ncbi:MAG: type II toxin-antitoxin system PemK/MazF family toxin [Cyanobacteria bacterium J06598_1]
MNRNLLKGDVVLVSFPEHSPSGHEQQGRRPAIVVGTPFGKTRYQLLPVVPLTTQSGDWVKENPMLYPVLALGTGNLTRESIVLLDQIRTVDARRIVKYFGSLSKKEYQPIADGLARIFG